ncbi:phage tail protein [Paenibacillus apiarius]|uniref:phage tail protein n=1 Tax=Paenibacillus apiarius TaxID=46240 RepID=UPI003B3AA664
MAYNRTEWKDHIVAPTGEVVQEGTPISARNLNNIEEGIYQLSQRIDDVKVPAASLTQAGITQLSNATDSTDETKAATPKAVYEAMKEAGNAQGAVDAHAEDQVRHITVPERTAWNAKETTEGAQAKANQAEANAKNASLPRSGGTITGGLAVNGTFTVQSRNVLGEIDNLKSSVVNGKGQVADAINGKSGRPVSANSTFPELAAAIQGLQQAKGNLELTSAFFDALGNYIGMNTMFINKNNNFMLYRFETIGSPVKCQSELHEVSPNGTILKKVNLGALQNIKPEYPAIGEDVVVVATQETAYKYFYEVFNHAGTLISRNSTPYPDVVYTKAVTRDGSNTFIVHNSNPVRVVNHAGTAYFTMPADSGGSSECVFLSRTKLYVARDDNSPIGRKHTLITRNNLSFSYAMGQSGIGFASVLNFIAAHAYR